MSVTASSSRRLDIGAVITDTFAVSQRNLRVFVLAAVLLAVAPGLVAAVLQWTFPSVLPVSVSVQTSAPGAPPNPPSLFPQVALPILIIDLVGLVLALVLQAGLFHAAVKDLEDGAPAGLGDMVSVGFKRFLPLLGLYILVGVAVWIGALFLLVPGVYLALRWCVAAPVLVVEGKGVFAAMKRSAVLTKGRRWTLFLILIIVFVILAVLDACFLALMGGFSGAMAFAATRAMTPSILLLTVIVSPILSIVLSILTGVFGGVLFQHLRRGRDGLAPSAVAEVFA